MYVLKTENRGYIKAGFNLECIKIGNILIPENKFGMFVVELALRKELTILTNQGKEVKGIWDSRNKIVEIGRYKINIKNLKNFVKYVFNGGYLGWRTNQPNWRPDFVWDAIRYARENIKERDWNFLKFNPKFNRFKLVAEKVKKG